MAIKNKVKYGVYLNPDNVEFLRKEYGDAAFMEEGGLSGLLDTCLCQAVRTIKFFGKNKVGVSRLKVKTVQEFFQIKEAV